MTKFKFLVGLGFLLLAAQFSSGQSTVANTPSTDTIEPGSFYFEVNYGGHFGKYAAGGYQTYGMRTVYGLRRNVEIGGNFYYTRDGENSPVEFVPNIKWKAYENEKYKFAVSGGAMVSIPLRAEKGARPSAFVYANASKGFDLANGFRVTGGVYSIIGAKSDSGSKKGVMIGYEQTLYKKISLYADWISGNNRFSYSGIGVGVPVTKKDVIFAGYNFGNTGRGNNWLSLTYGHTF
jgi:hypothetical protein